MTLEIPDNTIEEYDPLVQLRRHLLEWSNEIPQEILHGQRENMFHRGMCKVRKNWWQEVFNDLDFARKDGLIPAELLEEVDNFMAKFDSVGFKNRLTTKEDIEEANELIRKILKVNGI